MNATLKKQEFVRLVEQLSRLRDLLYKTDETAGIVESARKVVSSNLPRNLLRAAAIFVDYFKGFPPYSESFLPPDWVTAKDILPKEQRGSLCCRGFKEMCHLQEGDIVVLVADLNPPGLHAGYGGKDNDNQV